MNRRTGAAMLGAGLTLVPAAACSWETSEYRPPAPVVVEVGDITSDYCPAITEPHSVPSLAGPGEAETRAQQARRNLREAAGFAINRNLGEARVAYENIVADVEPNIHPSTHAEGSSSYYSQTEAWNILSKAGAFLGDPEGAQKGLIAICATLAGEVTIAETLLNEITSPETRATWEDEVEHWQAFRAEQSARNGDFDEAFRLLSFIDDEGKTVNEAAREAVEKWVEFAATQLASDYDGFEEAFAMSARADSRGEITGESIRDLVEEKVISAAEIEASHAVASQPESFEEALATARLVDGEGDVDEIEALDAVEAEIANAALSRAEAGELSVAHELADMVDDQGSVTRESVLASL